MTRQEAWVRFAAATIPSVPPSTLLRRENEGAAVDVARMADWMLAEMDKRFPVTYELTGHVNYMATTPCCCGCHLTAPVTP
jgi:hypothetical protein